MPIPHLDNIIVINIFFTGKLVKRNRFTEAQRSVLLEKYSVNIYPGTSEVMKIAKQISVKPEKVTVMFKKKCFG